MLHHYISLPLWVWLSVFFLVGYLGAWCALQKTGREARRKQKGKWEEQ